MRNGKRRIACLLFVKLAREDSVPELDRQIRHLPNTLLKES
jgi:hypothetical protein